MRGKYDIRWLNFNMEMRTILRAIRESRTRSLTYLWSQVLLPASVSHPWHVTCLCCVFGQYCPTPYDPKDYSMPGFPVLPYLLEFAQTHVHWIKDAIHPFHLLSSPSPPTFSLSQHQGLFHWVNSSYQVAKVLELQPQHQFFQQIFRVDFLGTDWFDLLAVQGTFKSLLPHHSSKASILWLSAFVMIQLSHQYLTTGKTISLARYTFVSKVMSLLFNMLSRFVIAFLPRSKCLNFMATVTFCSDFQAQDNKICHRETNANIQGWGEADI